MRTTAECRSAPAVDLRAVKELWPRPHVGSLAWTLSIVLVQSLNTGAVMDVLPFVRGASPSPAASTAADDRPPAWASSGRSHPPPHHRVAQQAPLAAGDRAGGLGDPPVHPPRPRPRRRPSVPWMRARGGLAFRRRPHSAGTERVGPRRPAPSVDFSLAASRQGEQGWCHRGSAGRRSTAAGAPSGAAPGRLAGQQRATVKDPHRKREAGNGKTRPHPRDHRHESIPQDEGGHARTGQRLSARYEKTDLCTHWPTRT